MRDLKLLLLLGGLLALLATGRTGAQEADPPSSPSAESADAEDTEPKITIHGYLSQAYAQSNGHQMIGITKDGTADYRSAALQIRADLTEEDSFVVQLSHERLGESPLMAYRDDVELDWLFYQHRFGDSDIRVGRVQIPFGIYNEVRDVGTLLPFFRPSLDFYGEGSFNSETVDGVVLSHTFDPWGSWGLDGDVYYGNFDFVGSDTEFFMNKVRNSRGIELWLQTPVPGLRIGAGGMRFAVQDTRRSSNPYVTWSVYHLSLAGKLGRLAANAEYSYWDEGKWAWETTYVQLGYAATEKITVNGQVDMANLAVRDVSYDNEADNDKVLGVNYAFHPDLVLKAEHHWNKGYYLENPLPDIFAPPLETRYWILSLSTSF
ncbi:MAG TPA: hypothetical protein VEW48_16925 [Thermoanaerobaculia bacterium]|nr:hypothetical protein [Thermoanaerobaculia bacterium]